MHHVATCRSASQSPSSHQTFSPTNDPSIPTKKRKVLASPESGFNSNLTVLVNQQQQSVDEQFSGLENNSEPCSSTNSGSRTTTRSRRVFKFTTTSALVVNRFKRLALNNKKLLRKYGVTSILIRDTANGEAPQRLDLPKHCPPSPPLNRPVKYKPIPKATQFTPITPNLVRGGSASTVSQLPSTRPNNKLATVAQQQTKSATSLSMEQRLGGAATVPQQINRIPSQQLVGQQMQQETGTSVNESPLLMNLLSSNNNQQMTQGNGMPPQQQHPSHQQQQMNPGMMRYPQQQPLQSPMYHGAQQSPSYMQGRMPPGNMQAHPMMMQQQMAPNSGMPGQHPQQMPPPVAQAPAPEQAPAKKRKRQTKKQKEEESKKQQQQQQVPAQMHPNMMHQGGMPQQQMHPEFYMMQQQSGQQRVPQMHMTPSQMQQYRSMSYPSYGQHYGQTPSTMMGTPPQYPGQQHYPQQMWNPNMPQQHHMTGQPDYMQQRGQMPPQQQQQQQQGGPNSNMHHYPAPQQSPVSDMKGRIDAHQNMPPSYNDSMQQQYVQQQRQNSSFMSPPPGQQPHSNQGPPSNFSMQQQGQSQQMMHQSQAAAQHYAQLQHQRVMSDISDNVDDIMATIGGGDAAEDFDLDLDSIEPMRAEGNEMPGMQHQNVPTPQQAQQSQHPGPSPHYYQQQAPQSMPPSYGSMYDSPNPQQFAPQQQQNYQMHPNMMSHQQMPPHQQIQREQQMVAQKNIEKNREQQQKLEQKQLEVAMNRSPDAPHSPSNADIPPYQQQRVVTAIECVMEKVMSGKPLELDSEASTSNQATPPPNKRKKQSNAKNSQQQQASNASRAQPAQIPVQAMPPQQPSGQFVGQMPPMNNMYGNGQQHPGTPTQFNNNQQQQFYYHQQRMQQQQQMMRQQMSYPGQQPPNPSTPLSAPPVSTPDQQYFYNQQQQHGGMAQTTNGAPPTPSRANSFKGIMPRNEASNPHTPQTPSQQQQPTPQQMSQKMFSQENGGSSATSSAAATPSSSSQHRTSIDEQSQPAQTHAFPPTREEQQFNQQAFSQHQQQYAQYNGHANQHFMYSQQSIENPNEAGNEIKMQTTNSAVSLKGGELNAPPTKLSTPPSANSGISSATPTTASQLNHHVETEPIQQAPKNEAPSIDLSAPILKHELNNSCVKEELLSPTHPVENDERGGFGPELVVKSELNGPTSTAAPTTTTSTVAE